MELQQKQKWFDFPAPFDAPTKILLAGIALIAIGVIGISVFEAFNPLGAAITAKYAMHASGASWLSGTAVFAFVALSGLWILIRNFLIPKAQELKKEMPVIHLLPLGSTKALPAPKLARVSVTPPDYLLHYLDKETRAEFWNRVSLYVNDVGRKGVCIVVHKGSDLVEVFYNGKDEYEPTTRNDSGLLENLLVEDYKYADETQAQYMSVCTEIAKGWERKGLNILSEKARLRSEDSPTIRRAGASILSPIVFLLLLSTSAFAAPLSETIISTLPAGIKDHVPKKECDLNVFFEGGRAVSLKTDGASNVAQIIETYMTEDASAFPRFEALFSCGNIIYRNPKDPTRPKPLFEGSAAAVGKTEFDTATVLRILRDADAKLDKGVRVIGVTGGAFAESQVFRLVKWGIFGYIAFLTFMTLVFFAESKVSRDGFVLFGREFVRLGSKAKVYLSFGWMALCAPIIFVFCYCGFQDDFTAFWSIFWHRDTAYFLVLLLLVSGLAWFVCKRIPDVNPDENYVDSSMYQITNNPRALPRGDR